MDDPDHPGQKMDYANNNVNNPSFGASKDSITGGLPLLKYMNVSNHCADILALHSFLSY